MIAGTQAGALCAICAKRPATVSDRIDGRLILACVPCRDDEVKAVPAPSVEQRIVRLVRTSPGITMDEIALNIDDSELGRNRIRQALSRARAAGAVVTVKSGSDHFYHPRRGYKTHRAAGP